MNETQRAKNAKKENFSEVGYVVGAIGGGVAKFFVGKAAGKAGKAGKIIRR